MVAYQWQRLLAKLIRKVARTNPCKISGYSCCVQHFSEYAGHIFTIPKTPAANKTGISGHKTSHAIFKGYVFNVLLNPRINAPGLTFLRNQVGGQRINYLFQLWINCSID